MQFCLQGSWLPNSNAMAYWIPYLVGAVARVHTLNGSFPHQNVVFFNPFQHLHVWIPHTYHIHVQHDHAGWLLQYSERERAKCPDACVQKGVC